MVLFSSRRRPPRATRTDPLLPYTTLSRPDLQDLAAQRQNGLEGAVPALVRRAAGRVALDQEECGLGRIAFLTVRERAGQGRHVKSRRLPDDLACTPDRKSTRLNSRHSCALRMPSSA